jgi:2-dehydro-3-deoxy-D-arabinonate dehydratase
LPCSNRILNFDISLAPVHRQEIWASGVTYKRSADAWIGSEGNEGNIYDKLYKSERPQTFFKGIASGVTGNNSYIGIRGDSNQTHPEAELVVFASQNGAILGYSLGNDVSARDIEISNPLYQPQSKVYAGSVAIGPNIVLNTPEINPLEWTISLSIQRNSCTLYEDSFNLSDLKYPLQTIIDTHCAYRDLPNGIAILTGTALAVPESAMLQDGDLVVINCREIGTLTSYARLLHDKK